MLNIIDPGKTSASQSVALTDITDEAAGVAAFDNHERVWLGSDRERGLTAIVAVHNSTLGPGCGGTRIWPYDTFDAALTDVLRLSRGMTFKSAIAGLDLGGGKAVIIADPKKGKTPELLQAYAEMLNMIGGEYLTAEDVGMTLADADFIANHSPFIMGTTAGGSGNPSPLTAHGVYLGIRAAWAWKTGRTSLGEVPIAIQGLGSVGWAVAEKLAEAGARLTVADIDENRVNRAVEAFGAESALPDEVLFTDVDIAAPCALGAILNEQSITELKAGVIAGAANNQLADHGDAWRLMKRGILYAPDYVINSGGIINVAGELAHDGYNRAAVDEQIAKIPETLTRIFQRSQAEKRPTNEVSLDMAREIIRAGR